MNSLPDEVLLEILKYIRLSLISLICKKWKDYAYSIGIRKKLYKFKKIRNSSSEFCLVKAVDAYILKESANSHFEKCMDEIKSKIVSPEYRSFSIDYNGCNIFMISFNFGSRCIYKVNIFLHKDRFKFNISSNIFYYSRYISKSTDIGCILEDIENKIKIHNSVNKEYDLLEGWSANTILKDIIFKIQKILKE